MTAAGVFRGYGDDVPTLYRPDGAGVASPSPVAQRWRQQAPRQLAADPREVGDRKG